MTLQRSDMAGQTPGGEIVPTAELLVRSEMRT